MNYPRPYYKPMNSNEAGAPQTIDIRMAVPADVPAIVSLVNSHALDGTVLPRSAESVHRTLDNWFVAVSGDRLLGCVSLLVYASGLVEVRSLVVGSRYRRLGIGSRLMQALLDGARQRRLPTLFALTRKTIFFKRFGFVTSERRLFPEKVWQDCLRCPLLDHCDETAMVLQLNYP
jgi:amino-acid N-acetyltransferase